MAKVASVAEAMRREDEKRKVKGPVPVVKLRAIARGQYGHPVSSIIDPPTEFKFRVQDLELYKKGMTYYGGVKVKTMTIEGKVYALPAWCEDAGQPSSLIEKDEDDDDTFVLADHPDAEM